MTMPEAIKTERWRSQLDENSAGHVPISYLYALEDTRTSLPRLLSRILAAPPEGIPRHHVRGHHIKPASLLFLSISFQSHQIQRTRYLKDTFIKPRTSSNQLHQIQ